MPPWLRRSPSLSGMRTSSRSLSILIGSLSGLAGTRGESIGPPPRPHRPFHPSTCCNRDVRGRRAGRHHALDVQHVLDGSVVGRLSSTRGGGGRGGRDRRGRPRPASAASTRALGEARGRRRRSACSPRRAHPCRGGSSVPCGRRRSGRRCPRSTARVRRPSPRSGPRNGSQGDDAVRPDELAEAQGDHVRIGHATIIPDHHRRPGHGTLAGDGSDDVAAAVPRRPRRVGPLRRTGRDADGRHRRSTAMADVGGERRQRQLRRRVRRRRRLRRARSSAPGAASPSCSAPARRRRASAPT